MDAPFVIAHLSDLHVSLFGDTLHDRAHLTKRSMEPVKAPDDRDGQKEQVEQVWAQAGFRVLRSVRKKRVRFTLLDPSGYAHPIPPLSQMKGVTDPVERAATRAKGLLFRAATTLLQDPPDDERLAALLAETPANTNLRLLRAARVVAAARPDVILLTGDLTDDGDGYELIEAVFRPWRERGRLLAIPGNHDLYLFPIASAARPRPTHKSKQKGWLDFARRLGLPLDQSGAWTVGFPDQGTILVGLNSCIGPQRRFFRQNGGIGKSQLSYLRKVAQTRPWQDARHRLVALHHHVVPLAHGVGRRAPTEIGMRLDDAREVAAVLDEIGATYVLHGHRHISEERQPAGCHFHLLAAPSLTLGCKSGDPPSFWRIELDTRVHTSRVYLPVAAVAQQNDPLPRLPAEVPANRA